MKVYKKYLKGKDANKRKVFAYERGVKVTVLNKAFLDNKKNK